MKKERMIDVIYLLVSVVYIITMYIHSEIVPTFIFYSGSVRIPDFLTEFSCNIIGAFYVSWKGVLIITAAYIVVKMVIRRKKVFK